VQSTVNVRRPGATRFWLRQFLGYGFAVVSVVLATVVTRDIQPLLGESISPLFFAAVMLSTWFGGMGPGLLSTALAGWASAYYFVNSSLVFDVDDAIRLVVFLMVSLLISSLTSLRKRAELALQQSHAELEQRVRQRTAELQQTNDRLQESEERFRLLVEGVADYAIIMLDARGRVASWNAGATRIHGFEAREIVEQNFACFFPAEDVLRRKPERQLADAARHGRHEDEGWRLRKDGARFWANVITTPLHDTAGTLYGFAQITQDITTIRALERQVLQISEQEQRRIGHDLHDGLGQELTGLAFLAQNLARKLAAQHLPEAPEASRLESLTTTAIEHIRELARGFSPVELGPDGLQAALRELADKVASIFGLHSQIACDPAARITNDTAALHLFRIAQEAVNNAVRHAKASRIDIGLRKVDNDIVLTIQDDGQGLPVPPHRAPGIGHSVMQYRAHMIGASLTIGAGDGKGTRVECIYPNPESFKVTHLTAPEDDAAVRAPEGQPHD